MKASDLSALTVPHPRKEGVHTWPVFEICLFSTEPRSQLRDRLHAATAAFLKESDGSFRWFKTSDMTRAERLSAPVEQVFKDFLHHAAFAEPGLLGLQVFCGERIDNYAPPSIALFSSALEDDRAPPALVWRTYLRCCLPLMEAPCGGQALFKIASALFDTGQWHCGHAGISIYWNTGDSAMERELERRAGLLLRHPALGYHDPMAFEPFIGHGLPQVSWITMLGPELCSRLGSTPTPAEFAGTQVGVVDLGPDRGVLLVAGTQPMLGGNDPASAAALEPYHQVGRRVAAASLPDERLEFLQLVGLDDEEKVRSWYRRFFDSRA